MSLARHQFTVQDGSGNVVPGAHVEVRREIPGQPLAALYSDRAGTVGIPNPSDADADGYFCFHVIGGAYQIRVYTGVSGAPTTEHIDRYVGIGMAQESDDISTGTVERTVIAAGVVTVTNDDADVILIKKAVAAPTRVVWPLAASTTKKVRVADRKYDAATNNITNVPARPLVVTISLASPGVVTLAAHGRAANDPVSFESTGALFTGMLPDTQYYVKTVLGPDTFTFSATPGGAAINTSGSQSGVHKMGTDTLMGGASYVIDSNGGSIEMKPLADGTGWI